MIYYLFLKGKKGDRLQFNITGELPSDRNTKTASFNDISENVAR